MCITMIDTYVHTYRAFREEITTLSLTVEETIHFCFGASFSIFHLMMISLQCHMQSQKWKMSLVPRQLIELDSAITLTQIWYQNETYPKITSNLLWIK